MISLCFLQQTSLCTVTKWNGFLLRPNSGPISVITHADLQVMTFFMAREFAQAIYFVFASTTSYLILNTIIELASVELIQESS